MIALRWIWFLVGVGVALQYLYWFVMTCAAAAGLVAAPHIPTFWIALALAETFLLSCEMRAKELKTLLD